MSATNMSEENNYLPLVLHEGLGVNQSALWKKERTLLLATLIKKKKEKKTEYVCMTLNKHLDNQTGLVVQHFFFNIAF